MTPSRPSLPVILLILFVAGCASGEVEPTTVRDLDAPGGAGSGRPNLFVADDGRAYLSWTEPEGDTLHALRYAFYERGRWSVAATVARGSDWFVNWADFPSLIVDAGGALAAHFLVKSGSAPYAYDVHLTRSSDGGKSWSDPLLPHSDGTPTEHGFVSMLPRGGGRTALVWLDGRATGGEGGHGGHAGAMSIRYAEVDANGSISEERVLDDRVCDCCQTAAVSEGDEIFVFYRDRSESEVRDLAYVRRREGAWSEPAVVAEDGWEIHGCPVNGPSADSNDGVVAVAWFTAAQERPRVQVAFSTAGGGGFGEPFVVSDGSSPSGGTPLGRVAVVMLDDGSAIVSWIEARAGAAEIRYRRIEQDGSADPPRTLRATDPSRSSGFPQMARQGNDLLFAWTDVGPPSRLRTAVVPLR